MALRLHGNAARVQGSGPTELLQHELLFTFLNYIELVSFHVAESLAESTGPEHLNRVGKPCRSNPKMCAKVALREVATASHNLADLGHPARPHADASPGCVAIALGSDELEVKKVIPGTAPIVQKCGWVIIVRHQHVHIAVVVEVCEGHAAAGIRNRKSIAGSLADICKFPFSVIVE